MARRRERRGEGGRRRRGKSQQQGDRRRGGGDGIQWRWWARRRSRRRRGEERKGWPEGSAVLIRILRRKEIHNFCDFTIFVAAERNELLRGGGNRCGTTEWGSVEGIWLLPIGLSCMHFEIGNNQMKLILFPRGVGGAHGTLFRYRLSLILDRWRVRRL